LHNEQWIVEAFATIVCTPRFVEASFAAGFGFDFASILSQSVEVAADGDAPPSLTKLLRGISRFVKSKAHILAQSPWKTMEQYLNYPDFVEGVVDRARLELGLGDCTSSEMLQHYSQDRAGLRCVSTFYPSFAFCDIDKPQELDPSLATLLGHESDIQTVCCSPDHARIASAGSDKSIRIWDAISGESLTPLPAASTVASICFSGDKAGNWLVTASEDDIYMWEVASAKQFKLEGHVAKINCVTFFPSSPYIASASADASVRIWSIDDLIKHDMASWQYRDDGIHHIADASLTSSLKISGHSTPVLSVSCKSNETHLVSLAVSEIKIWEIKSLKNESQDLSVAKVSCLATIDVLAGHMIEFVPGMPWVVCGCMPLAATGAEFSFNGGMKPSVGGSGAGGVGGVGGEGFAAPAGRPIGGGFGMGTRPGDFAGGGAGPQVAANPLVAIPSTTTENSEFEKSAEVSSEKPVQYATECSLSIFDIEPLINDEHFDPVKACIGQLDGYSDKGVSSLTFTQNALITGAPTGRICSYDIAKFIADGTTRSKDLTPYRLIKLCNHSQPIQSICALRGNVVAAYKDASIRIWELAQTQTSGMLGRIDKMCSVSAFSPCGSTIAMATQGQLMSNQQRDQVDKEYSTVEIWPTELLVARGQDCSPQSINFELIKTMTGHDDNISCLCFSASGEWLASAAGMIIRVWDPTTSACVAIWEAHGSGKSVRSLSFGQWGGSQWLTAVVGRHSQFFNLVHI
jgi:WD40 repeat protein